MNIKKILNFGKYRVIASVIGNVIIMLLVDVIGLKYWQYMMFGVPFNFFVSYQLNKRAFKVQNDTKCDKCGILMPECAVPFHKC